MEGLQQLEHRAVVIVEQPARNTHFVVGRDADEVLVERPVVDRAEAEPVAHYRLAGGIRVSHDVGGVEQPHLLEVTDRARISVGDEYLPAETLLVESDASLAHCATALDCILVLNRLSLVEWSAHPTRGDENASGCGVVGS